MLGGIPFTEPVLMWWTFVGRTHEEIAGFREEWEAASERFGRVDPPPCVQFGRRDDLRGDVGGRGVAGTGGVLMGADHCAVHPDRPVRALGHVRAAPQRVEDPGQAAVA